MSKSSEEFDWLQLAAASWEDIEADDLAVEVRSVAIATRGWTLIRDAGENDGR